jgi:hypothetical protein
MALVEFIDALSSLPYTQRVGGGKSSVYASQDVINSVLASI